MSAGVAQSAIDERVDVFFECRRWSGEPTLLESDKAAGLNWFPLGEMPEPVVPHELYVFEHLRDARQLPPIITFGLTSREREAAASGPCHRGPDVIDALTPAGANDPAVA